MLNSVLGQNLNQTIRGTVKDADSELPLTGVTVILLDEGIQQGAMTDENGQFRIEKVAVGRVNLRFSFLGYETITIPNIVVNSGKEVVLNIAMQEAVVSTDEVVISVDRNKGQPLNDMALISAQSISAEETNRFAGGFNDPSRIMSNFAGVTNTQDGSNDIIIRGNSPKYIQWRLEGIQITNPNHFGDQSSVGGSTSTLNNNMIATSDFHTGAFSPEFGDVLAGVYDVKLRTGNNEKFESVFGFGLLGTDLTLEGPFKKGYGGSYVVNYRYSTATIIDDLGLLGDVGGVPKFQDAAFKIVLPTNKLGTFSMFGLAGLSSFLFEDVSPAIWKTPGDNAMQPDVQEDFEKGAFLLNTGLNHLLPINANSFIKTTVAYSNDGYEDEIFESRFRTKLDSAGLLQHDSLLSRKLNYTGRLRRSTFRSAITYNNKFNARNKIQIGVKYADIGLENRQSQLIGNTDERFTLVDFNERIRTVRNFVSWKHRLNENLTILGGVHNMNVLLTGETTFEPRLAVSWKLNSSSSIRAGYGLHSTMESVHNYFAKVAQPDGSIIEPNLDLGLLKAHHYVLSFEKQFGKNVRLKVEGYYQDLFNLPVENDASSFYATINEGLDFQYVDLVNEGTGKNYGVEVTLEKFFSNNFYYMINASLFQSKYTPLDGIERNTQYNGNYLTNILFGKEFEGLGKKQNQTLGLNAKVFFGGGKKIIPLLRDEDGNLAVDPENNRFWDFSKAYENKIDDIHQVTVSASYKWNRPKATHELFLNLDNITNTKGRSSEFYDPREPGSIGYQRQFGIFPNLMYRVYF